MQLAAYANGSTQPNTIFANKEYETVYNGLDINFYKSLEV